MTICSNIHYLSGLYIPICIPGYISFWKTIQKFVTVSTFNSACSRGYRPLIYETLNFCHISDTCYCSRKKIRMSMIFLKKLKL